MATTPTPYAAQPGRPAQSGSPDGTVNQVGSSLPGDASGPGGSPSGGWWRPAAPLDAVQVLPVRGIREVSSGDDVAALIQTGCATTGLDLQYGDIVVVSSKILSKAAGLRASDRGDAIDRSTVRVVAERTAPDGVTRVVESVAGPVMAAGGVDASNTGGSDGVLLLPPDPDAAAAALLADLLRVGGLAAGSLGVVVTDTAGRPWRAGQTDFALGAAGVRVLDDLRGSIDADGRPLAVTARALVDEIAAAADLVKGKATGVPVAVVRGLGSLLVDAFDDEAGSTEVARSLVRTGPTDWFRMGHLEAVRAALGVQPGSAEAAAVGVRPLLPEGVSERLARVVRLAQVASPGTGSVEVTDDALNVTAVDDFELGVLATRLVTAGWTEDLAIATTDRGSHRVTLSVVDLAPLAPGPTSSRPPA